MPIFHQFATCCQLEGPCVCGDEERVLRAYSEGRYIETMTKEQREWCLDEADHAGEGSYPKKEAEGLSDAMLAKWVLQAWSDYVRSHC